MSLVVVPLRPLTPPRSSSMQLRQQLATTQRLLDGYDARGTASDLRELAAAANHGHEHGRGRDRGRTGQGDFVTYGRSRTRALTAASVPAAATGRGPVYVGKDYDSLSV